MSYRWIRLPRCHPHRRRRESPRRSSLTASRFRRHLRRCSDRISRWTLCRRRRRPANSRFATRRSSQAPRWVSRLYRHRPARSSARPERYVALDPSSPPPRTLWPPRARPRTPPGRSPIKCTQIVSRWTATRSRITIRTRPRTFTLTWTTPPIPPRTVPIQDLRRARRPLPRIRPISHPHRPSCHHRLMALSRHTRIPRVSAGKTPRSNRYISPATITRSTIRSGRIPTWTPSDVAPWNKGLVITRRRLIWPNWRPPPVRSRNDGWPYKSRRRRPSRRPAPARRSHLIYRRNRSPVVRRCRNGSRRRLEDPTARGSRRRRSWRRPTKRRQAISSRTSRG